MPVRLARGGDYMYESLHIRKGGHVFPVRTHATTFVDAPENSRRQGTQECR